MDAPRRLWPRSDLRVGDADRQAVVSELQRHFIDGRLSSDELGERLTAALNARTFADLASVLHDLPVLADPSAAEPRKEPERQSWPPSRQMGPSLGAVLMLIGVLAMLWLIMLPGQHFAFFFPWPLLIWGFFVVGRPFRGRRF